MRAQEWKNLVDNALGEKFGGGCNVTEISPQKGEMVAIVKFVRDNHFCECAVTADSHVLLATKSLFLGDPIYWQGDGMYRKMGEKWHKVISLGEIEDIYKYGHPEYGLAYVQISDTVKSSID